MMPYREAANRIEDHMCIHYFEEYPRAQKITEALQIAIDLLRDMATLQEGGELIIPRGSPIKMLEDPLEQDGTEKKTCKTCGNECQMIGLNMPACTSYKEFSERKVGFYHE